MGVAPWVGELREQACGGVLKLRRRRSHAPELSEGVEAVFAKAFTKDPADRYESVTEFAASLSLALGAGAADEATSAPATRVIATPVAPEPKGDVPPSCPPQSPEGALSARRRSPAPWAR